MLVAFSSVCSFCCPHTASIAPLLLYVHHVNSVLFVPFTALIVQLCMMYLAERRCTVSSFLILEAVCGSQ